MGSRIKKEAILAAIPESGGIYSLIAKRLDVAWSTAKRLVEMYPDTLQAYNDEVERILDLAESKLYNRVNMGDSQDIKWFLSKKGKRRGYGDAVDIKHAGEIKIGWKEFVSGSSSDPGTDSK